MYLSHLDMVAVTIALTSAMFLIVTSALANARLTRENQALRTQVSALRNVIGN